MFANPGQTDGWTFQRWLYTACIAMMTPCKNITYLGNIQKYILIYLQVSNVLQICIVFCPVGAFLQGLPQSDFLNAPLIYHT